MGLAHQSTEIACHFTSIPHNGFIRYSPLWPQCRGLSSANCRLKGGHYGYIPRHDGARSSDSWFKLLHATVLPRSHERFCSLLHAAARRVNHSRYQQVSTAYGALLSPASSFLSASWRRCLGANSYRRSRRPWTAAGWQAPTAIPRIDSANNPIHYAEFSISPSNGPSPDPCPEYETLSPTDGFV